MPKTELRECPNCGEKPTRPMHRRITDDETGRTRFAGNYYACLCRAMTFGDSGYNLKGPEPT